MKYFKKIIEYLFYLFVFLLPWQTRWMWFENRLNGGYFEYGSFSLYGIDILFLFILVLSLVYLFWNYKNKTLFLQNIREKIKSIEKINYSIIAFIVFVFISILIAFDGALALYAAFRFLQGALLLLLVLVLSFSFKRLSWAFIFSALLQSFLAIYQFMSQSTFANKWLGLAFHDPAVGGTFVVETALRRFLRAYGSLPHPNMLAGFLIVSLIILIGLYLKTNYSYKKICLIVSFIIISFGLLTTFSRGAFLALIFGIIFFWLKVLFRKSDWEVKSSLIKFTLLILLITTVFAFMYSQPFLVRVMGEQRLELKSNIERLTYNQQALELIRNSWFWGVGVGNYTLGVHRLINPFWSVWQYQPVHNIYLLAFVELGVIGFLIFISLLVFTFLKTIKSDVYSWQNIFFINFIMLLIISFFDHYLWTLYFGISIFWLNLGLLLRSKIDSK